ncbi:MAG: MerR family transcriptional regulator [Erysipelotrichaceae bacterium]|nr:MerR family transcriptional regulator [Erysipelotrichaceae bacterium]MBQ3384240.1 MerR family transcriptional regulator [Erysipelotrichaceae bacterium]
MYTIKEVAEIVEENEHTIRYYAKLNLFPNIRRDKYNSRVFTDEDIDDVRLVICLADTGMPLDKIREFMRLSKEGYQGNRKRYQILREHETTARNNLIKFQKAVQLLEWRTYQFGQKYK